MNFNSKNKGIPKGEPSAGPKNPFAGAAGNAGDLTRMAKLIAGGVKFAAAAMLVGYVATHCLYTVEGGHLAIKFNRLSGIQEQAIPEGTHFLIPWLERPEIFSVRVKSRPITSLTGTKDLQMVNLQIRVLSRPDERKLPTIYRTLGKDYDERVIPSIANEVMKSVVAQFTAAQLTTQREKISQLIKKSMTERARHFNIVLEDVVINNIAFSPEYMHAVEAKQVASQEVERMRFIVEKAEQDKRQMIARAEGEAQAAKLISEVLRSNPAYLDLKRIEYARDIANVLAKSQNRIYLNSDALLLNLFAPRAEHEHKK